MLAGTETSLTYEINSDFKNKPQNLKLYTDENYQNELYVENNMLNLKDFIGLHDPQQVSKVIYWEWKEETGDTEEEIHENDLKDSEFMGKKLEMAISVTGRQDMASSNNYYMVTLDANGGKIGSSASVQKQVTGGEEYGELPMPTREGYTFMGWNGKNLVDLNVCGKTNCNVENNKVYFDASHIEGNIANSLNVQFWYSDGKRDTQNTTIENVSRKKYSNIFNSKATREYNNTSLIQVNKMEDCNYQIVIIFLKLESHTRYRII